MSTALITGASRGLGLAVATELAARGWDLVVDARDGEALRAAVRDLPGRGVTSIVAGDVADPVHREHLAEVVREHGRLDLLLNNASTLGPSPLPALAAVPVEALAATLEVNTLAPLALVQQTLPQLRAAGGVVIDVSSDAAVEPYPGWGVYGASKAALDQLTAILGAEHPELSVYAFDPGDMRTAMHQEAFPGEHISDRPEPATVVPALLHLLDDRPPSGRYRAVDLALTGGGVR